MKKKRTILQLIALILFVIVILTSLYLYVNLRSHTTGKKATLKLYYYDPIGKELIPVQKEMVLPKDNTLAVKKIVDALKTPTQNDLFSPLNNNTAVKSVNVKNNICTLSLNEKATETSQLSVRKEAIRVYGLVNSLTELPDIDSVQILIDGKKKTYFNHYIQIDHPISHYSGVLPKGREVFLYLPDPDGNNLLLEKREIISQRDPVTLAKEIIQELLYGSLKGLPPSFPVDTKINDFYIRSGGIAVVDFSSDILKHPSGAHSEYLAVLSLVNSLTELPDITSVQILIDGKVIPTLFGSVDISHPIKRFYALTEESGVMVPYYVYTKDGEKFFMPVVKTTDSKDSIKTLFNLLKNQQKVGTYIPEGSRLLAYKMEGVMLIINISVPESSDKEINNIKQQIMLSYTELPSVKKIKLNINGKEFLLSR